MQGHHGFPVEFVCHTTSWMHKSNCLILQLALTLTWGVCFTGFSNQIYFKREGTALYVHIVYEVLNHS